MANDLSDVEMASMTESTGRLRMRLFPRAETAVKRGHPWVFSDSIKEQNRAGEAGELAVIYDRRDRFMGVGMYDPDSPIRLRIVHVGKPATIDRAWWLDKVGECYQRRLREMLSDRTTGGRLINGESEGFPGLVADWYAGTLVVKIYTGAWLPRWEEMEGVFREALPLDFLVLRMSRNIQEVASERWGLVEGFRGETGQDVVVFEENGIRFESAVCEGQKTGFFLDQRDNRARVELLADSRDVLNVFSFSGGFSLYAARGGAKSVTDLDISAHALESAKRNFQLNDQCEKISQVEYHQVQADAFKWMDEESSMYDLIIVDPPSLAKREREREGAIRAYERLNRRAIERLSPDGVLVAASCSAHVSEDEFFDLVLQQAHKSGRRFNVLWKHGHAPDHPVSFPEARYLKAFAVAFDG